MPYIPKNDHRDNTAAKSQWTITPNEELASFKLALKRNWLETAFLGWGLHAPNGYAENLGMSAAAEGDPRELFIAKFITSSLNNIWHGYPADPYRNDQDIPAPQILKQWGNMNFIRPALVRKINKGQKCSL